MGTSRVGLSLDCRWMGDHLQIPDDKLMAQGAAGDEQAFRILVERWERPVFAFMVRMLGSREDAQDLVQETFMRMISAAGNYQASGQFQSWLFRIAGNQARSRLRRRKILRWLPFDHDRDDLPAHDASPLEELERAEIQAEMRRCIAKLPVRQREALLLKQYQGLKYREIAEAMDLSVAAVQMLLHRAMEALRKEYARKGLSDD